MKIEGTVRIGEATRWAASAMSPLTGQPWPLIVGNLVAGALALAGVGLISVLDALDVVSGIVWLPCLLVVIVGGTIAGTRLCRLMIQRNFRRALIERGVADPQPLSIELLPNALVTRTAATEHRVAWSGVSEVLRVGPYWFLLADAAPICIPRRWFATPADERAFLAQVSERLSPESRERSPQVGTELGAVT